MNTVRNAKQFLNSLEGERLKAHDSFLSAAISNKDLHPTFREDFKRRRIVIRQQLMDGMNGTDKS